MKSYNIRLDENDKDAATAIFADLGMDFSTGIRIYLQQVIQNNGIPFPLVKQDNNYDVKNG
ncbi:type II toxin-antitoxin system RelB/DinJ family antitoxin [Ligilactobacillus saerimneri]|uniref:type II toxin-antitoxin system RelB/DinJ family antitoxin n=1 Tax=Ligilactobacillus saerimneri TaxID=228229 RepID=UPI0030CC5D18